METQPDQPTRLGRRAAINAALQIHDGAAEFGYRFIADDLPEHGITASENHVQRLWLLQKIWSVHSRSAA